MTPPPGWKRLFRLDRVEKKLDESLEDEIQFHIEELTDQFIRQGLAPEDARREVRRRFGDVEAISHACRRVDEWGARRRRYRFNLTSCSLDLRVGLVLIRFLGLTATISPAHRMTSGSAG